MPTEAPNEPGALAASEGTMSVIWKNSSPDMSRMYAPPVVMALPFILLGAPTTAPMEQWGTHAHLHLRAHAGS